MLSLCQDNMLWSLNSLMRKGLSTICETFEGKYLLWYRKGVPTETLQTMWCLLTAPAPFLSPCGGLESRIGVTKGKIRSWDRKNLLKTTMKYEINSNSNNIDKRVYKKGKHFTRERLTMEKLVTYKLPPCYPNLEGTPSPVPRKWGEVVQSTLCVYKN